MNVAIACDIAQLKSDVRCSVIVHIVFVNLLTPAFVINLSLCSQSDNNRFACGMARLKRDIRCYVISLIVFKDVNFVDACVCHKYITSRTTR